VAPKYTPPGRIHCHRPTVNVFGYLTDDRHQHRHRQTGLGGSLAETFAVVVVVVNLATVWVWSVASDEVDAAAVAVEAKCWTLLRDTATVVAVDGGAVRLATTRMTAVVVHLVVLVMMAFVVDMTLALTVLPA
jgi:hypothetical protein